MGNTEVANEKYCIRQIKKWAEMLEDRFQKNAEFEKFKSGGINISSYNINLDNNDFLSADAILTKTVQLYAGLLGK